MHNPLDLLPLLIGTVILVLGVFIMSRGLRSTRAATTSRNWHRVSGTVSSRTFHEQQNHPGKIADARPVVKAHWTGEAEYTGPDGVRRTAQQLDDTGDAPPVGTTVVVFVNPQDPAQAYFSANGQAGPAGGGMLTIAFGAVFAMGGCWLLAKVITTLAH